MSETKPDSPSDSPRPETRTIRIGRVQIALNVALQIVAFVALILMVNFLSFRHHRTIDWSGHRAYTLSPQTKAVLKQFQEPCKAIVYFFNTGSTVFEDTVNLLKEYETQSNRKLQLEVVDPRDPARQRELQAKYKFYDREDIVILDYKGKSKWVEATEFAELEDLPPDKQRPEEGITARIKNFKGEQYITAAMMDVLEEKPNKVYLLTGHGELDLNNPEFKISRQFMERQNYTVQNLSLTGVDKVPDDANGVVIAGPAQDYTERDLKILDEYWKRNGRFLVALGPEAKAERLSDWLAARGVTMMNDSVIGIARKVLEDQNTKFEVREAVGLFTSSSPISKPRAGINITFLGLNNTQSMKPVDLMLKAGEIAFTPLVGSAPNWYGETDPFDDKNFPSYTPGKDHKGPLVLAVAVEKGAARDPKVQLDTPRLVVVGNGIFMSDSALKASPLGTDLLVNSLNWLLGRETLLELPPKEKPLNDIALSDEKIVRLGFLIILGIPACFGILGVYYLWWRHGRNLLLLTIVILAVGLALWGTIEAVRGWASGTPVEASANVTN